MTWYRPAMPEPEQHDAHVWLHLSVQTLQLWGWYIDYRKAIYEPRLYVSEPGEDIEWSELCDPTSWTTKVDNRH